MQEITQIGHPNWSRAEIINSIPEFLALYSRRPIDFNEGGMKSMHMFATWFMLKRLNPKIVIESGVWKGQGTWLIENTLPKSKIYSIDINLDLIEYKSKNAEYIDIDFTKVDWNSKNFDKNNTLLFFDDHQNALERVKQAKAFGFWHLIFEDNYPASQGDCYSLKKAFMKSGFIPQRPKEFNWNSFFIKKAKVKKIQPNSEDAEFLTNNLEIYYEFPPLFKSNTTRWEDDWNEENYPTPEPLFLEFNRNELRLIKDEAKYYTWICYAKLKNDLPSSE